MPKKSSKDPVKNSSDHQSGQISPRPAPIQSQSQLLNSDSNILMDFHKSQFDGQELNHSLDFNRLRETFNFNLPTNQNLQINPRSRSENQSIDIEMASLQKGDFQIKRRKNRSNKLTKIQRKEIKTLVEKLISKSKESQRENSNSRNSKKAQSLIQLFIKKLSDYEWQKNFEQTFVTLTLHKVETLKNYDSFMNSPEQVVTTITAIAQDQNTLREKLRLKQNISKDGNDLIQRNCNQLERQFVVEFYHELFFKCNVIAFWAQVRKNSCFPVVELDDSSLFDDMDQKLRLTSKFLDIHAIKQMISAFDEVWKEMVSIFERQKKTTLNWESLKQRLISMIKPEETQQEEKKETSQSTQKQKITKRQSNTPDSHINGSTIRRTINQAPETTAIKAQQISDSRNSPLIICPILQQEDEEFYEIREPDSYNYFNDVPSVIHQIPIQLDDDSWWFGLY